MSDPNLFDISLQRYEEEVARGLTAYNRRANMPRTSRIPFFARMSPLTQLQSFLSVLPGIQRFGSIAHIEHERATVYLRTDQTVCCAVES